MHPLTDAQIASAVRMLGKYATAIVIGRDLEHKWGGSTGEQSEAPVVCSTLEEAIWNMAEAILNDMQKGINREPV